MTSSGTSAGRSRHLSGGMTLIETLVSMAIASLVVTVLAHILAQSSRIEQQLSAASLQVRTVELRAEWLRQTLESIMPLPEGERDQFQGDASAMRGLSSQVPNWPQSATAPFLLEFVQASDGAGHELVLRSGSPEAGSSMTRFVILAWKGKPGAFAYLTADGKWVDKWPQQRATPGTSQLPRAIAVTTQADELQLLVAAPLSSGIPRFRRSQLERL